MIHSLALVLTLAHAIPEDRLASFPTTDLPTSGAVSIAWDAHAIPFVTAERDEDVPFALGLIQAHLRLGQLELVRRISQGRVSELVGPLAIGIDHTLRILDPGRARNEIMASWPPASRVWAERFLLGVNTYLERNPKAIPEDLKFLGVTSIPRWTLDELVTAWRMTAFDINWAPYLYYLHVNAKDRDRVWKLLIEAGLTSVPSFTAADDALGRLAFDFSRTGSNSLVLGKAKTKSGAGLIMNDPHLGLNVPNTWLIAGVRSPSYHAVGLMLPTLPFFALGRNPDLAWGGTNLWGLSSYMYALEGEPKLESRRERIKVRGWFDRDVTVRTSAVGPIVSDSPYAKWSGAPVALKWVGHEASDELTAFLRVMKAKTIGEFRAAFATYGVSAMNMLAADRTGEVTHVLAYRRPVRPDDTDRRAVQPLSNLWAKTTAATELPFAKRTDFIASANNRPFEGAPQIGWFFQSSDRVTRLRSLAENAEKVGVADLTRWQRDVFSETSLKLKELLVAKAQRHDVTRDPNWATFAGWNGSYDADSRGAAAFELTLFDLAPKILKRLALGDEGAGAVLKSPNAGAVLLREVSQMEPGEVQRLLTQSLFRARAGLRRYPKWSDLHRVEVAHVLGKIPLLGARWRFGEFGHGGGADTVFKTAAPRANTRSTAFYGSNARHVSDLSDPDQNLFVLFGGQDGWMSSPQALDQVDLWRRGEYVRVPLSARPDVFPRRLELKSK